MINAQEHDPEDMDQGISERLPLSYLRPLIIDGVYQDPDKQVVRKLTMITAEAELESNLESQSSAADQQLFEIVCYALELSGCLERREHVKYIKQQAIDFINDGSNYSPDSVQVLDDVNRALQIHARCLEEIDCMIRLYRGASPGKKDQLSQQQSSPDIQTAACFQEVDAMAQLFANNIYSFKLETLQDAKLVLTALIEHELNSIGRRPTIRT